MAAQTCTSDVILQSSELRSRSKIVSPTEDKTGDADNQRPKMTKEGTFTKESPTSTIDSQSLPAGDEQQQHEGEIPADKQVTKIESTHTLLDKVEFL